MKLNRLLLTLLAAATILTLPACIKDKTPTPAETTAPVVETTAAPATVDLVTGGAANYVIVRPEDASETEIKAAIAVRDAITALTGATPNLTTDWVKRGQEYDPNTREILIGACGQPEMAAVRANIGYGEYAIRAEGNKFVIAAWGDDNIYRAALAFAADIEKLGFGGSLSLPGDYLLTDTVDEVIDRLPVYENGTMKNVVDVADDNRMLYITDTTAEAYDAYRKALESSGFTLYTSRQVGDNRFATYTTAENTVNAYFNAAAKEARIIIEPLSALPPRAEDTDQSSDKYEPAVRMVGLEYNYSGTETNQIGLMLIFRLPDGRLIVVDGGGYYEKNASLLMQNLREMAPDPNNITVAAWVLTHAHGDHTGGFIRFTNTYAGKVNVERVIYNFTTKAQYALVDDYGRDDQARSAAKALGDEVIRAHNGQVYHFGSATMEILYTFEDFEPQPLPYHNTTSLVFRISMGGQTVMVLGDAYTLSNNIMSKMYGNYLKSDIVQVTHHGYQGGTTQVYDLIDAETALWPGGIGNFSRLSARAENAHVLKKSKDLYIAADDAITLTLPYAVLGNNQYYAK